ncbi:MAG: CBS domain-containing protein [Burkholderiales bacterium]|nr:CBS domain-containing protein [Burkholderiales bacterium]
MIIREILAFKGGATFSTSPEKPVVEAIQQMVERSIGSLIVLDDTGKMVGIITERDILRAVHKYACDLGTFKVTDLMTTRLIVGGPEDTVDHVRGMMTENHIRHLPVVEGAALLGVITFHDVAKACLNEASFQNKLLKGYIKNWPEEE